MITTYIRMYRHVYIHTCIHTHTHGHAYICTHIYPRTCTHVHTACVHVVVCMQCASVATELVHLGHLGHFLSRSKWVSPGHTYMPDLDQNYLVITCIEAAMERSILSNRAVTSISGCDLESSYIGWEYYKVSLIASLSAGYRIIELVYIALDHCLLHRMHWLYN